VVGVAGASSEPGPVGDIRIVTALPLFVIFAARAVQRWEERPGTSVAYGEN
jgi:hypothetical protein